jgi:hypothetical protein
MTCLKYKRRVLHLQACKNIHILACIPVAVQRLGKHIPAEANAPNNWTSTATQQICKHASLTLVAVFSEWSVQSGYKEVFSSIK